MPKSFKCPQKVPVTDLQVKVYSLVPCRHCWPQIQEFDRNINRRIR